MVEPDSRGRSARNTVLYLTLHAPQDCLKTGKGFIHSKRTSTAVKWMNGPAMALHSLFLHSGLAPLACWIKSKFSYLQQIVPPSCANLSTHYQSKTCMSSPSWPSLFLHQHPNLQIYHSKPYKFKRYHGLTFPWMTLTPHCYKQQMGWGNATYQ